MYTVNEIKALLSSVDSSSVTELKIENADNKLVIKKGQVLSQPLALAQTLQESVEVIPKSITKAEASEQSAQISGKAIESPMAGVFYAASAPDAEPYVTVGKPVKEGDVVCIVEAMKLMNEITATESGVIKEILVENGQIVEYGQPLFTIG